MNAQPSTITPHQHPGQDTAPHSPARDPRRCTLQGHTTGNTNHTPAPPPARPRQQPSTATTCTTHTTPAATTAQHSSTTTTAKTRGSTNQHEPTALTTSPQRHHYATRLDHLTAQRLETQR